MNSPNDQPDHPDPHTAAITHAVNNFMSEYFDGYILVAFVAGTNEPVRVSNVDDPKCAHGLRSLIAETYQALPHS